MSGKAHFQDGEHKPAIIEGPATALSWLTVVPVRGATAFDRITGARVMASLPFVGIVIGGVQAGIGYGLSFITASSLLIGVLVTVFGQLLTRFMHLDGLADVADALGSYAPPEKAREILSDPHAGLIGMAAALLSLLTQVVAVSVLAESEWFWALFFIPVIGRWCGMIGAHHRFSPMKSTGFAALVIGTVPTWWIAAWWVAITAVAAVTVPLVAFCLSTLTAAVVALVLARHCTKRLGGLNGDTCGFIIEISAAVFAAMLAALVGL
jgi:hypothetical protein